MNAVVLLSLICLWY